MDKIYKYDLINDTVEKIDEFFYANILQTDLYKTIIEFDEELKGIGDNKPLFDSEGVTTDFTDLEIKEPFSSINLYTMFLDGTEIKIFGESDYIFNLRDELNDLNEYTISFFDRDNNYVAIYNIYDNFLNIADNYKSFRYKSPIIKVNYISKKFISGESKNNKIFNVILENDLYKLSIIKFDFIKEIIGRYTKEVLDEFYKREYDILSVESSACFIKYYNNEIEIFYKDINQDQNLFDLKSNYVYNDDSIYYCEMFNEANSTKIIINSINFRTEKYNYYNLSLDLSETEGRIIDIFLELKDDELNLFLLNENGLIFQIMFNEDMYKYCSEDLSQIKKIYMNKILVSRLSDIILSEAEIFTNSVNDYFDLYLKTSNNILKITELGTNKDPNKISSKGDLTWSSYKAINIERNFGSLTKQKIFGSMEYIGASNKNIELKYGEIIGKISPYTF